MRELTASSELRTIDWLLYNHYLTYLSTYMPLKNYLSIFRYSTSTRRLVDMTSLQLRLYKGILQRSDALRVNSMLSMPQLRATLSQRWSACAVPTTQSLTPLLTYPITAAAITGQSGLRLPRVHQTGRDGHQPCQRWLNYIRIYHLFNLIMENNASCTIDIDLIISIHSLQQLS